MAAVGPGSREAYALYGAVRAAQAAALDGVQPGLEIVAVDAAARNVLDAKGLGEAFLHGTGHGLGLEIHEAPRVARGGADAEGRLEAGMVFTIEPGIYVAGHFGVRYENIIHLGEKGPESMNESPRKHSFAS